MKTQYVDINGKLSTNIERTLDHAIELASSGDLDSAINMLRRTLGMTNPVARAVVLRLVALHEGQAMRH